MKHPITMTVLAALIGLTPIARTAPASTPTKVTAGGGLQPAPTPVPPGQVQPLASPVSWPGLLPPRVLAPAPRVASLNGKQALLVDGAPFLVLGVYDEAGFLSWPPSDGFCTGSARFGPHAYLGDGQKQLSDWEVYYVWAKQLGFNTVSLTFPWEFFEDRGADGKIRWYDDFHGCASYPLLWHRQMAEKHGLKLVLRWFGSIFSPGFDRVPGHIEADEASYPRFVGGTTTEGGEPHQCFVYDYCDPDADPAVDDTILDRERAALSRVASWLAQNDPKRTYIMLQINNEVGLPLESGGTPGIDLFDRARCSQAFPDCAQACGHAADAPPDVREQCNQCVFRRYYQELAAAVHAAYPELPTFMNVFLTNRGGLEDPWGSVVAGSPDPTDDSEHDAAGICSQEGLDQNLQAWLDECPDTPSSARTSITSAHRPRPWTRARGTRTA